MQTQEILRVKAVNTKHEQINNSESIDDKLSNAESVTLSTEDLQYLLRQCQKEHKNTHNIPTPTITDWLLFMLKHIKHIIAIAAVTSLIVTIYSVFCMPTKYTAVSKILMCSSGDSVDLSTLSSGSSKLADYRELMKNWYVYEWVDDQMDLSCTYTELIQSLELENPSGSHVLYLYATANTAEEAQELADTYAEAMIFFCKRLLDEEEPTMFENALLPFKPSSPNLRWNLVRSNILVVVVSCFYLTYRLIFPGVPEKHKKSSEKKKKSSAARKKH